MGWERGGGGVTQSDRSEVKAYVGSLPFSFYIYTVFVNKSQLKR